MGKACRSQRGQFNITAVTLTRHREDWSMKAVTFTCSLERLPWLPFFDAIAKETLRQLEVE